MELYIDIYQLIIDLLPYDIYPKLRLVSTDWHNYIETTEFQRVLKLGRIIYNTAPVLITEDDYHKCFYDGTFMFKGLWCIYRNGAIISYKSYNNQTIQKIINTYGVFELYNYESNFYVKVNNENPVLVPCGLYLPRFIRTDDQVHLVTGCSFYKYENNQLICIENKLDLFNDYTYKTYNGDYTNHNHHRITLFKNNKKLGIIWVHTNNYVIGIDYIVIHKNDKHHFWKVEH